MVHSELWLFDSNMCCVFTLHNDILDFTRNPYALIIPQTDSALAKSKRKSAAKYLIHKATGHSDMCCFFGW